MTLIRTKQIYIKDDDNISSMCHCAKNLYNEANYFARQRFFNYGIAPNFNEIDKLMNGKASEPSENYTQLDSTNAQQVLRILKNNWKSFFSSIKDYKKYPNKYTGRPKAPKYLDKNGEFVLKFPGQRIKNQIKDGYINFPKKTGFKPIKIPNIKGKIIEVRIIPLGVGYNCEIVYEKDNRENIIHRRWYNKNRDNVVGIDIGLTNLVTMVNNIGEDPIVIKGGIVKSINQFYHKEIARLQSIKDKQGITKRTALQKSLTQNRSNRIKDQMHKISRFVVDYCIEYNIGTIVIGKNDGWKQNINIGKRNNQNFVSVPFDNLIKMIQYKAEEVFIEVICHEESYTSKCSFLDNEPIMHHNKYAGKRVKRGLFRSANNTSINADVNGAYNIMRKVFPKLFDNGIEAFRLMPVSITLTN